MRSFALVLCLLLQADEAHSAIVRFKQQCLAVLVAQTPSLLASQDKKTGRFGKGIWINRDQEVMFPLVAVWSTRAEANPYYHRADVLEAIMAGGDALVADLDPDGREEFRKKDGSTWGKIYMPWTYSRWIRTFVIIRQAMPEERRKRWEKALTLGYTGIAHEIQSAQPRNIPAHHAMGLYFAGVAFDRPDWKAQARQFLLKVAAAQHPDGYWSEHEGPVVNYGFPYVDAIGTYVAASQDTAFADTLLRAARFHSTFTYPDGTDIETIDERNPYSGKVRMPTSGFSLNPEGRSYIARQIAHFQPGIPADEATSLLLYGQEGEGASTPSDHGDYDFALSDGKAAIHRRGPWLVVLSAITSPVSESRWIQDRENFVSIYHDKLGLVLGGGNTKLQPYWGNFSEGDPGSFFHHAGDENPAFVPPVTLSYTPTHAELLKGSAMGVAMTYGTRRAVLELKIVDASKLDMELRADPAMTAHLTFLPRLGSTVKTAAGQTAELDDKTLQWDPEQLGAQLDYAGIHLQIPTGASVRWPSLAHNPYRKDGRSELTEARFVINVPMKGEPSTLRVSVP